MPVHEVKVNRLGAGSGYRQVDRGYRRSGSKNHNLEPAAA
jgi:hypothetical protein